MLSLHSLDINLHCFLLVFNDKKSSEKRSKDVVDNKINMMRPLDICVTRGLSGMFRAIKTR